MTKIYYRRIVAGEITINDVPKRYLETVKKLLEGDDNNENE